MKNTLFPIFLKTEHLQFLIIGGGNVGLEKASTLLKQNPSAKIKVISRLIKDELKQLSHTHENLQLIEKDFEDFLGYKSLVRQDMKPIKVMQKLEKKEICPTKLEDLHEIVKALLIIFLH